MRRRAFDVLDVLACPACGGRLRLIRLAFHPATIRAILDYSAIPVPGDQRGYAYEDRALPVGEHPLEDQLAVGGRLVIAVGAAVQTLMVITRTADGTRREEIIPVQYVPMTGEVERRPR